LFGPVTGARLLVVDGRGAGTWEITVHDAATLRITMLRALTADERDAVVAGGERLPTMFAPEPKGAYRVSFTGAWPAGADDAVGTLVASRVEEPGAWAARDRSDRPPRVPTVVRSTTPHRSVSR